MNSEMNTSEPGGSPATMGALRHPSWSQGAVQAMRRRLHELANVFTGAHDCRLACSPSIWQEDHCSITPPTSARAVIAAVFWCGRFAASCWPPAANWKPPEAGAQRPAQGRVGDFIRKHARHGGNGDDGYKHGKMGRRRYPVTVLACPRAHEWVTRVLPARKCQSVQSSVR